MSATTTHITVRVPLKIRRRPGRKTLVTPVVTDGATTQPTRADPALVKALARGFRYQRLLDEGRYATISEMAAAERLERGYLGSLLRLTLLAPDVVEAILNGTLPHGSTFADFESGAPALWEDQRALFGRCRSGRGSLTSPSLARRASAAAPFVKEKGVKLTLSSR